MDAPHTQPRFYSAGLAVSFMVALCLPLVSMVAGWGRGPELGEKRVSVPPPALPRTLAEWKEYPRTFEKYFNDSFGWRNWLIVGRSLLVIKGWAVHPSVLYDAKCGKMFYRPDKLTGGLLMPTWDKRNRDRICDFILRHQRVARSRSMSYLFVAVPSRLSVYPEAHPVGRYLQNRRLLDAVEEKFEERRNGGFIELLDVLEARRQKPIYYRFDTHWTDAGARLAYERIVEGLKEQELPIEPIPASEFRPVEEPMAGDITGLLGLNHFPRFLETRTTPVHRLSTLRALHALGEAGETTETLEDGPENLLKACRDSRRFRLSGTSGGPRLLVFRDSCTVALVPYLAEHFSEATFIWTRPGDYDYGKWLERVRPDVVLEIFGEYNIQRL